MYHCAPQVRSCYCTHITFLYRIRFDGKSLETTLYLIHATLFCTLFSPSCYFGFLACFFLPPQHLTSFLLYSAEWLLSYRLVCQYCSDPYQLPLSNRLGQNWRTRRYQNTQQYCTLFCKTGSLIKFTHYKKENIIVFWLVLFWSQKLTKCLDFS